MKRQIAVAKGDGIGLEIMDAVLSVFDAASVPLDYKFVEMSKAVFDKGFSTGMTPEAKETIESLGILYKGPMETPKGKGVKSINVTARKVWNTYANVRKFRLLKGVDTVFSKAGIPINMTILRENIEDTYGGVEYMHNTDVAVCYRFITRPGTEQFIRFCFDYAKKQGIKKVYCGHKANIMKLTDGLFLQIFQEIGKEYPEIEKADVIVDDLAMKLVKSPDMFELVCLPNLQGDIISDLCAGLVGGLGFAPSANIGDNISIFEAVHGTAPDIAGQNKANPTSLLLSGVMMLRHLGLISYADTIENALLATLEQGAHTGDFGDKSTPILSTTDFTGKIISNIGNKPSVGAVNTGTPDFEFIRPNKPTQNLMMGNAPSQFDTVVGCDVFVTHESFASEVAQIISDNLPSNMKLLMISNRGTQVHPSGSIYTDCVKHHRCRVVAQDGQTITRIDIWKAVTQLNSVLQVEDVSVLKEWGDFRGYSLAQGQ